VYKKDKIEIALKRSRSILDLLGLSGWGIETDNSYSVIAKTKHDEKKIVYSKRYIAIATEEEFHRTTIHEATHALLGYGKGHGSEFIELCNRLSPSMPYDGYCTGAAIHKYTVSCSGCNTSTTSNSSKENWCMPCASNGTGVYKLEVIRNLLVSRVWASTH